MQFGDVPRLVEFRDVAGVARVNGATLAALANPRVSPMGAQIDATKLTNTTMPTCPRPATPSSAYALWTMTAMPAP